MTNVEPVVSVVSEASVKDATRYSTSILQMLDRKKRSFGVLFEKQGVKISRKGVRRKRSSRCLICIAVEGQGQVEIRLGLGTSKQLLSTDNRNKLAAVLGKCGDLFRSRISQTF